MRAAARLLLLGTAIAAILVIVRAANVPSSPRRRPVVEREVASSTTMPGPVTPPAETIAAVEPPPPVSLEGRSMTELVAALRSARDAWERADIIDALALLRSEHTAPIIAEQLRDPDPGVRLVVVQALEESGDETVLGALERALAREDDPRVHDGLVAAIRSLRDPD